MNTSIFDLIAYIETKNCLCAMRFEKGVYGRATLIGPLTPNSGRILSNIRDVHTTAWGTCSWETARMIYSASYGAVQMMGFNLYGLCGYTKTVTEFLASQADQELILHKFLAANHLSDYSPEFLAVNKAERLVFAKTYNGSIDYNAPMELALKHFGFSITE